MKLEQYRVYWDAVSPFMRTKLHELKELLQQNIPYEVTELYEGGDEEFKVLMDIKQGDDLLLGIDFSLLDSDVHGSEGQGVGVSLLLMLPGGLVVGAYTPNNYTEEAFTNDSAEAVQRVRGLDIAELFQHIKNKALPQAMLAHITAVN